MVQDLATLVADDDLTRMFWRGLSSPEELSASEMRRFVSVLNVFMRRESVAYYLYKEGKTDAGSRYCTRGPVM